MPTTVTKSIGTTSRDYSTLQAWEDAAPADLTAVDQIWRGEAYNDSEFTARLTVAGSTVDATRYVELTTAAGQSFQDNANVRTNALRYNQSNGVGVNVASNYNLTISSAYARVSKLQFKQTGNGGVLGNCANIVKDCIGDGGGGSATIFGATPGGIFVNCLGIVHGTFSGGCFVGGTNYGGTVKFIGCTAVNPSNLSVQGTGFSVSNSGTSLLESCASFGFTNGSAGTGWSGSKNNATDAASINGTSNQTSVTYNGTSPFTQASDSGGSQDYRAIASTSLAANGFLDSTNAPNDISGLARAASPTIGAWELAAAGGGVIPNKQYVTNVAVKTASLW